MFATKFNWKLSSNVKLCSRYWVENNEGILFLKQNFNTGSVKTILNPVLNIFVDKIGFEIRIELTFKTKSE